MDTHLGPHGALRRTTAVDTFGAATVRQRLSARTWAVVWTRVLVDATRRGDPLTLAAAAIELAAHPDAVLTGPTATHLLGLSTLPPTPIHLQVPYCHLLRSRTGLVVHNGPLAAGDRTIVDGLPVLALTRVLADLVCTLKPPDAVAIMDEALARVAEEDRDALRSAVTAQVRIRPDPRGTVRGPHLIDLATGRAESPAESKLLWRVADAGFPIPEVNHWVTDLDGRRLYRIDLAWPFHRIALEYHGYAAHIGRTTEDTAREEDLRRRGWEVVVVWADDAPGKFESDLDAAFRKRGVDTSRRDRRVLSGRRHREPWARSA